MKIKLSASEIVASVIMGAITYFSYQTIKGSLKNKAKKNEVVKVPTKPIDVFFAKSSETEYSLKKFGDKFLTVKANIDGRIIQLSNLEALRMIAECAKAEGNHDVVGNANIILKNPKPHYSWFVSQNENGHTYE